MKTKMTVSKAKKKAWEVFSKYIRARDSQGESGACFTCNREYPIKLLQAGHWIPGRHNSVLFDERNVHAQCYHCNVGLKSNPIVYYDRMIEVYGRDVCDDLIILDHQTKQFKVFELLEIAENYEQKLKLLERKDI